MYDSSCLIEHFMSRLHQMIYPTENLYPLKHFFDEDIETSFLFVFLVGEDRISW